MPDDKTTDASGSPQTAPTAPASGGQPTAPSPAMVASAPRMSPEVAATKAPWWKRVIWWVLGILAAVGAFIGLILLLKGSKKASEAASKQIDHAKAQVQKAEVVEKIKIAEARKEEEVVINKLKEIEKITDEKKQADELAAML